MSPSIDQLSMHQHRPSVDQISMQPSQRDSSSPSLKVIYIRLVDKVPQVFQNMFTMRCRGIRFINQQNFNQTANYCEKPVLDE